jgi:calcium-dependent protein kinase
VLPLLHSGAFSEVYVTVVKETGEKRAVKRIQKKMMTTVVKGKRVTDLQPIEREVQLQHECCQGSENIVKIFDVYDSGPTVDIVLESMKKDDLFDAIETVYYPEDGSIDVAECYYTELAASRIIKQVIAAVGACHEHGICHRDLKPENILVHTYISDQEPLVKLCDFGLATRAEGNSLSEACGTPEYVAPEVVTRNENYGLAADIWSLGVILYILLCGEQPFHSDRDGQSGTAAVIDQVKKHSSIRPRLAENDMWDDISDSAKDLLDTGMLARDPSKRLTAAQLLAHPWVTGEAAPQTHMAKALLRNHKTWLRRKFRVAIYTLVATNRIRALIHGFKAQQLIDGVADLTIETHYNALLESFLTVVPEPHGMVEKEKFTATLQKHGVAAGQEAMHFDAFQEGFGTGGVAHVNFRDYVVSMGWRCSCDDRAKVTLIFKAFDLDRNGIIDHDEFVLLLNRVATIGKNERKTPAQSSALFTKIDTNEDGQIDEAEFLAWALQVRRNCLHSLCVVSHLSSVPIVVRC